jgi:hypothetical protein
MSVKVNIAANDAGFTSTVKKVNDSMNGMDDNVKKASSSVKMSFGAMVKAGAALAVGFGAIKMAAAAIGNTLGEFKAALDLGGELSDLSARTGETAGNLMLLRRAFDNSGAGADKVGPAINKLQKFMEDAAQGSEKNTEALTRLGLSYDDLKGKTPTEQMEMLAERISTIEDPAQRAAAAMQIFGKSGGELLPLLSSFSGELETAKAQLGSMPGVMDRANATFDSISDNLTVIKGKFLEFAAGLLEKIAPALDLVTTLMTRIDTAAIGMRLGDVITGASAAMGGFSDALAAIKLGEFGTAFEITWASIKLQAADSINSIYANLNAMVSASVEFISAMFGPGSGLFTMLKSTFEILGNVFSSSILNALKLVGNSLGSIFDGPMLKILKVVSPVSASLIEGFAKMGNVFDGAISDIDTKIGNSTNKISNSIEQIGGDIKLAAGESGKAYDAAIQSSGKLIDTSVLGLELEKSKTALFAKQSEEAKKNLDITDALNSLEVKAGGQRVSNAERIKELEAEIKTARAQGNEQLAAELDQQKKYYEQLETALASGKTTQDALTSAAKAYNAEADAAVVKQAKITNELREQLSVSQQMAKAIKESGGTDRTGSRIQEKFKEAQSAGDRSGMDRQQRRMERNEMDQAINKAFGGGDKLGKSVQDLAKDQGIDTFGKTSRELRKELADKAKERQGEMVPGKGGKPGEVPGQPKVVDNPMDAIRKAVDAIQKLVEKIEPKLPTAALGV